MNPRIRRWKRIAVACGMMMPFVLLGGTILSAANYVGRNQEPFSIRDHFISELGEVGTSQLAHLFNATLMASGAIVVGFMVGMGLHIANRWALAAAGLGIISGVSCMLVGVIPMNNLLPHVVVSFSFFYSGMAAVVFFTQAIWLDRRNRLPRYLMWPGLLTFASFFALALAPAVLGLTSIESLDPRRVERAALGPIPFIEWCVFAMIIVWVVSMSIGLALNPRPDAATLDLKE
jgi:hypothetical membrane protein